MVTITGCPCGETHEMSDEAKAAFDAVTAGLPETAKITVKGLGTWDVPRVFPACHRFSGQQLPGLAERYGFRRLK